MPRFSIPVTIEVDDVDGPSAWRQVHNMIAPISTIYFELGDPEPVDDLDAELVCTCQPGDPDAGARGAGGPDPDCPIDGQADEPDQEE